MNGTSECITIITWTDIVIAVSSALTLIVLICAFYIAKREIKCIDKTREAEILTELSKRWNEEQLTESRKTARNYKGSAELKDALETARKKNIKEYYRLVRIPDFFEALGVLVNSSCLDKQLTIDLFGSAIEHYYELYKPSIEYLRDFHNDKNIYKWFDNLVTDINKLKRGV